MPTNICASQSVSVLVRQLPVYQEGCRVYAGGTSTGTTASGLYEGYTYQGGTKVVDFTQSSVITWLSEAGVTEARQGMGGPGGGPGQGGGGGGGGMGMPPEGGGEPPQRK